MGLLFVGVGSTRHPAIIYLCRFHGGSFSLRYRLKGPILNRNPVNVKQMNRIEKCCPSSHLSSVLRHFSIVTRTSSFIPHLSALFDNTFQFITPSFCHLMVLFRYSLHQLYSDWNGIIKSVVLAHKKNTDPTIRNTRMVSKYASIYVCVSSNQIQWKIPFISVLSLRHLFFVCVWMY